MERHGQPGAESEAVALIARTASEREAARDALASQLAACDARRLADRLAGQRLLALADRRLSDLGLGAGLDELHERAARVHRAMLIRSLALDATAAEVLQRLAASGIRAVLLKGPSLSERLYGDPGLRTSSDVDVLVAPEHLHAAVEALVASGYPAPEESLDGRTPHLHHVFQDPAGRRPPVELHWRVHWYERAYAQDVVARAEVDGQGRSVPAPIDDVAILLLVWARDGLMGLRGAIDAATAWELHRQALGARGLTPLAEAHPRLAAPLDAATLAVEAMTGVPRSALLPGAPAPSRRARAAARMASAEVLEGRAAEGAVAAVDAMLTPVLGARDFLGRHVAPSTDELARLYDLDGASRVRRAGRRLLHAQGALRGLLTHAGGHGLRSVTGRRR